MKVEVKALRVLFLAIFVIVATSFAKAQSTVGSVYGSVVDPAGAAIPAASISLKEVHTGVALTGVSNAQGEYVFTTVNPGDYSLTVTSAGFKAQTQTGITVASNVNVHVPVTMVIGGVAETVEVQAGVTLVDTREAQLGDTIDQQKVQNLPTEDRNAFALLDTVTGVQSVNLDSNIGSRNGAGFSVNGFPAASPSFYFDGAYDNAFKAQGGDKIPNPDAIQEFRVITSNFDAEFGRSPGGVVNVISRSGTDHYHGSAYEFLRNDVFNAKPYFQAGKVPLQRQDQFGGTFGGPVPIVPKTFFFLSYEHFLLHQTQVTNPTTQTATALERTGNFTDESAAIKTAMSAKGKGFKTSTGAACPNPLIVCTVLDPVAQKVLAYVPTFNISSGLMVGADGVTPLELIAPADTSADQGLGRIDYNGIHKHQIEGTFFNSVGIQQDPGSNGSNNLIGLAGLFAPYANMNNYENQMNAVLADNWILTDRTVNSVRGFYSQNRYIIGNTIPGPQYSDLGSYGAPGGPIHGPPQFSIAGYFTAGPNANGPSDINQLEFGLIDTATLTRGRHSIKIGGSWDSEKYSETASNAAGNGIFAYTAGNNTGNALADFIAGYPNTYKVTSNNHHRDRKQDPALFVQDDWQVTRRLTLDLGVRWEVFGTFTGEPYEQTFKAGAQSTVIPNAPLGIQYVGDTGIPDGIYGTSYARFAPRVGFAYDAYGNGRTSIRGGFGIFYNTFGATDVNSMVAAPYQITVTTQKPPNPECPYGVTTGAICPAGTPASTTGNPFPYTFNASSKQFTSNAAVSAAPPGEKSTPYANEFNLSVEQQLSRDTALRVSYVGATYMKQYISVDDNAPVFYPGAATTQAGVNCRRPYQPYIATSIPSPAGPNCTFGTFDSVASFQFAAISTNTPENNQSYHSLQVNLHGKIKRLNFSSSYVWGKALNYIGATVDNYRFYLNHGPADIDLRNRFTFSGVYRFPEAHFWGFFGRELIGGWQLSDVTIIQSGSPFTVTSGSDTNFDGVTNDRTNITGDPYTHASTRAGKIAAYLNPAAFSVPSDVNPGDTGDGNEQRDSLYGPKFINNNGSVFKEFSLYKSLRFQFRFDAFNLLNNVNLGTPRTNFSVFPSSTTQFTGQAGNPRQLQFSAKVMF